MTFLQGTIALTALFLTFSKAGFICLVLLTLLILVERRSLGLTILAVIVFAVAGFGMNYVFQNDLFSLTGEQRQRLGDVLNILGGEVSSRTTTGRTLMWELGLRRIEDQLPWGAGLGQFHSLEGGSRGSLKVWLGVHNTFLMILGEGGLLPFVLFIAFLLRFFILGFRAKERVVAIGFGMVAVVDMFSSHSTLGFRISNIALATMIAIAGRVALSASREAGVTNSPARWRASPGFASFATTRSGTASSGMQRSRSC